MYVIISELCQKFQVIYNNARCLMLALNMSHKRYSFFISHILSIKAIQIRSGKPFSFMDIIYRLSLKISSESA